MVSEGNRRSLRDIGNKIGRNNIPSDKDNVFVRLSMSPSKTAGQKGFLKPPMRLSPRRTDVTKHSIQVTPRRIVSPECLKGYIPKVTQSLDRPQFKNTSGDMKVQSSDHITNLIFPTSPTKLTFSNENKIGGDGSLTRIRARFKNGLMSPERIQQQHQVPQILPSQAKNGTGVTDEPNENSYDNELSQDKLKAKNLLSELKKEEEDLGNGIESVTKSNTKLNSMLAKEGKVQKASFQKSVKFKLPDDIVTTEIAELRDIKDLLLQMLRRQREIESRLTNIELQLTEIPKHK
ncbi:Fin1p [Saccharomyces cerevisiae x Saccharomyces kudriavzevii VIN7]|uniref:Fin1p n=1 Tax=Saccharomyces cerevisiae x Saccharomyces kudriavzevii (strain VIN7) TaxID=1095631 RepID=H0GSS1_SACCK|nr:Fin1p [Saccharomyces cerevisiae x Saccharomyces kudriavzevii VIN7]